MECSRCCVYLQTAGETRLLALVVGRELDSAVFPAEDDAAVRALEPQLPACGDDDSDELEHEEGDDDPSEHDRGDPQAGVSLLLP